MSDDIKPGQVIEPNSKDSDVSSTPAVPTQPAAGFTPAPNPFEAKPAATIGNPDSTTAPVVPAPTATGAESTSSITPTTTPSAPSQPFGQGAVFGTTIDPEPLREAPAVSPAQTPPTTGSGHPDTGTTPSSPPPVNDPVPQNPLLSQSGEVPMPAAADDSVPIQPDAQLNSIPQASEIPTEPVLESNSVVENTTETPVSQPITQPVAQPKEKKKGILARLGIGKKTAEQKAQPSGPPVAETMHLDWQAPEFVQTAKPLGWYVLVGGFFLVLIILAIFTQQWISIGLFALMGATLAVYANRKPRVLEYGMSNVSASVGHKKFLYSDFSSYYQTHDYNQVVFDLVPNKRFGTLVSLPAPHDMIEKIDEILAGALPKTEPHDDAIDKLFRALRF